MGISVKQRIIFVSATELIFVPLPGFSNFAFSFKLKHNKYFCLSRAATSSHDRVFQNFLSGLEERKTKGKPEK